MGQPGLTTGWRLAASATLHCLTGCAIGEVLGMIVGTAVGLHNAATVALAIVLAFVFGYALTVSEPFGPDCPSAARSGSRSPLTPSPSRSWRSSTTR